MIRLRQVCALLLAVAAILYAAPLMAQDTAIPERFTEPEGWEWGRFTNAQGAGIRFGRLTVDNPRAIAVIVTGFREFGEKYFEVVRDLNARGFDVWQMDWRGQGGSDHYLPDTHKPWYQGYDRDAADLQQFATEIVERPAGAPMFVLAHSMGGHITIRHLHDYPGTFDFAALTAPMLRINTGSIPKWIARPLAWSGNVIAGESYVVGGSAWAYDPEFAVEDSDVSQDPVRFRVGEEYMRLKPELQLGSATYGWLRNAFKSIALINEPAYLSEIATPVLIASPRNDQIVLPAAHDDACAAMPGCELFPIADAKHEIWMERDEYRDPWLDRLDAFVDRQIEAARN